MRPIFLQSIAEFWQRWHISLSTWFRDYLYIPLGGNRKGTLRKYLNVLVTFAVSGLWHGAQWNYMAWGLLNGLYQVIGAALMPAAHGSGARAAHRPQVPPPQAAAGGGHLCAVQLHNGVLPRLPPDGCGAHLHQHADRT